MTKNSFIHESSCQCSHSLPKRLAVGLRRLQFGVDACEGGFHLTITCAFLASLDQVRLQTNGPRSHKCAQVPTGPHLQWLWWCAAIGTMPDDVFRSCDTSKNWLHRLRLWHTTCHWLLKSWAATAKISKGHCQSRDYQWLIGQMADPQKQTGRSTNQTEPLPKSTPKSQTQQHHTNPESINITPTYKNWDTETK